MQIYDYDQNTGELIGSRQARCLPGREDLPDTDPTKWQISANATTIAPPAPQAGKAICFVDGAWELLADHREEKWWKAHGEPVTVDKIGDPAAEGLSATEPAETAEAVQLRNKQAALAQLAKNDDVAVRCLKAGVAYPQAWRDYDAALRAIVGNPPADPAVLLPAPPPYPAGT